MGSLCSNRIFGTSWTSKFIIPCSIFDIHFRSFISLFRGEVCNAFNLCRRSPSAHITCSSAASIQPYSAECRNFLFAEGIRSGASGSAVPKQELGNKEQFKIHHSAFIIRYSNLFLGENFGFEVAFPSLPRSGQFF